MKHLLSFLLILALPLCALAPAAQAADRPELVIPYAPVYGSGDPVRGFVRGVSDPSRYHVTLYLQTSEGGQYWVKPSELTPFVEPGPGGSFALFYASAGTDLNAVALHLLVLPPDYTPTLYGFQDALAHSLDYVCVRRSANGTNVIEPDRYYTGKTVSCAPGAGRLLVDTGFYTDGGYPGSGLSRSLITAQLDALDGIASGVRLYAASGEVSPAYSLAKSRGLFVFGTAHLTGDKAADRAEMDALISHCNSGRAKVAVVGNETLFSGKLTEDELVDCIAYVRAGITKSSVPVTTSDTIDRLLSSPRVLDAVDLLMPNVYPYWEGKKMPAAAEAFFGAVNELRRCARGKQIVISETGWPTVEEADGPDAAEYFETLWAWSLRTGTPVLWFEGADEPWKASDEGAEGAHWGFFTKDLKLKPDYEALGFFQSAAAGITPRVVSFEPNGGSGSMHPRATGRGYQLVLPDCAFTAPKNREFSGWLAGGRLYRPGDSCVFEADATVCAYWLPAGEEPFVLPAGLTSVQEDSFSRSRVRYVIVPEGCVSIGARAFAGCGSLVEVVLPGSVSSVAADAFPDSSGITVLAPAGSYAASWAKKRGFTVRTLP